MGFEPDLYIRKFRQNKKSSYMSRLQALFVVTFLSSFLGFSLDKRKASLLGGK